MGYRAWLDQQAQRQDDNTYLIRPWGSRSGVYRIDAPTKDRWVRFRVASYWLTGIVTVLVFALNADRPWMSLYVISSAALAFTALLMARYGASRWILRHADRVPDERWKGSGVRWSVVPRRRYLWSVIWFGFLTALFAWSMLDETSGDAFRQYGPLVLLLSAWLLFSIFAYWRAGLEQKAYGDQQDGGSSIATVSTVVHTAKAGMGARRTLLAILIAPSATTLVAIIFWVIELLDGHSKFDPTSQGFKSNVETLLVILGTCYALSYTVGIPIYLLARRRRWRTRGAYLAGAVLMGVAGYFALIPVILIWSAALGSEKFQAILDLTWSKHGLLDPHVLIGATAISIIFTPIGLMFWLIERPDRST